MSRLPDRRRLDAAVSRGAGFAARRDDGGLSWRGPGGRGVPGRLFAAQHVPPLLCRRARSTWPSCRCSPRSWKAGEDAQGFARDAFNGLAGVLIVFTVIGTLAMPWLVWAMASGFAGDERFDLAVTVRAHRVLLHPVHLAGRAAVGRAERLRPLHRGQLRAGPDEPDVHRRDAAGRPAWAGTWA